MRVKANVRCFVDDSIREEGDIFEYSGLPCETVTAVEVEKPKVKRSKPEQDLTDTE